MTPPEIDQLIEEGLTLYGQGDLDGALLAWEKALLVDPENAQAASYVDYVRQNYDLLTSDPPTDESKAPFGIDDEPYQIEILPSEMEHLRPSDKSITTNFVDEGWFMDDEQAAPPPELKLETETEAPQVSFEDQTREYENGARAPAEVAAGDSARGEFSGSDSTPGLDTWRGGFASQPTNLRERDTGFVKPAAPARPNRPSQVPAEIQMTLRTPGETVDPFDNGGLATDTPPPIGNVSVSYDDPPSSLTPAAAELVNSLPSPTRTPLRGTQPLDPATGKPRTGTAELPPSLRPPAPEPGPLMPSTFTRDTITRDFESQKTNAAMPKLPAMPAMSASQAREMKPGELPTDLLFGREMISAPTRDLGLRPGSTPSLPDEDKTATGMRKAAPAVGDGTRADLILPFDPIDARSAQILDEIDEGAPDREAPEDRTRRRVTLLFEKALAWSQGGELDKAVAAIDLALSEDPNSALGQKLIHRHRDQMLAVFQNFLGDLDRQPILARPLHELANAPISPRAAFLLSRIDGMVTLDELLDVSGMPRMEAYRYLCQLFLRGILR